MSRKENSHIRAYLLLLGTLNHNYYTAWSMVCYSLISIAPSNTHAGDAYCMGTLPTPVNTEGGPLYFHHVNEQARFRRYMVNRNFAPSCDGDDIVFGSNRPCRNSSDTIENWLSFMKENGIMRVVCLLDEQLGKYDNLLSDYDEHFGENNVCSAKIPDYEICSTDTLNKIIIPFLEESISKNMPTVIHCSAGMGRTGHVLAAWRYYHHNMDIEKCLDGKYYSGNRNPLEAIYTKSKKLGRYPTRQDFVDLLQSTKV